MRHEQSIALQASEPPNSVSGLTTRSTSSQTWSRLTRVPDTTTSASTTTSNNQQYYEPGYEPYDEQYDEDYYDEQDDGGYDEQYDYQYGQQFGSTTLGPTFHIIEYSTINIFVNTGPSNARALPQPVHDTLENTDHCSRRRNRRRRRRRGNALRAPAQQLPGPRPIQSETSPQQQQQQEPPQQPQRQDQQHQQHQRQQLGEPKFKQEESEKQGPKIKQEEEEDVEEVRRWFGPGLLPGAFGPGPLPVSTAGDYYGGFNDSEDEAERRPGHRVSIASPWGVVGNFNGSPVLIDPAAHALPVSRPGRRRNIKTAWASDRRDVRRAINHKAAEEGAANSEWPG
ncbi:hypothetical protein VTJ49DRAFT_2877 [Mycothermus thermophilus]|uniref:Uncharacterized protein n=1 Tax=Humicola insolens TaxID=85995 RepID=A0ABR3V8Y9_HUMIN